MATKVTFDTANRYIELKSGVTEIDFVKDVYSEGKADWLNNDVLNPFAFPVRVVGGDDIGGGQFVPVFFFLQYGWKIRTPGEGLDISIKLNVYSDDGSSPVIVQTPDNVTIQVSEIPQIQSGSGLSAAQDAVLSRILDLLEADEEFTPTTAKKLKRGTTDLLLLKSVSGGKIANPPITIKE